MQKLDGDGEKDSDGDVDEGVWKEEVRHRRTKGDGGVGLGEGQRHQVTDRPQSSQDMRHEPDQGQKMNRMKKMQI